MPNNPKAKLKTLYVMRILQEETDSERGLSLPQIIERLEGYGIQAERKGIYRDLDILRDYGLDIQKYNRRPVEYAIAKRDFTLSELMLLVDAVESCRFLTERQSKKLITNLKLLASDGQRAKLDRHIHVPGRITSKNESVFGTIDVLHDAIRRRKKVSFMYYKHDALGNRFATHDGKPHIVTPVAISFTDGYYYLTAWNEEHDDFTEYRVDRMGRLMVTDEDAVKNSRITHHAFDGDEYESFGRFNGEAVVATLEMDADKVEIVLDRFGDKMQIMSADDGRVRAAVKVRKSQQFFGWLAGLGGTVRIADPLSLKREYNDYLKSLIED